MVNGGFIQNSKLLIQIFAARAECAFPTDHFLTGFTGLTRFGGTGEDGGGAAVAVLLRASRLRRDAVASDWWRVDADGGGSSWRCCE